MRASWVIALAIAVATANPAAAEPPAAGPATAPSTVAPETAPSQPLPAATPAAASPVAASPTTPAPATSPPVAAAPEAPAAPAASVTPAPPPAKTLHLSVDLASQRLSVTENGQVRHTWPISSGTRNYRTPTGTFTPTWTSRMHYSRQWDWAPMPFAVFFNRGVAFHGTAATRSLGSPASHGCIRLATGNAKTLFNLVHKHGLKHVKVVVHGTPKFKEPLVAQRRAPPGSFGYAPPPRRYRYSGTYGYGGYRYGYGYGAGDPYYGAPARRRPPARRTRGSRGAVWY